MISGSWMDVLSVSCPYCRVPADDVQGKPNTTALRNNNALPDMETGFSRDFCCARFIGIIVLQTNPSQPLLVVVPPLYTCSEGWSALSIKCDQKAVR